ncbi:MmgE/PrpD family protein [Nocardioides jishulii]|uniref:MmgE/PrpD family protein n=1 Tax=Nocardioides jishulii TaxID=2575440 RepID=UPI001485954E|nr:MmgE/PrpD family protein [Nocardioides jishulii]
MTSAPVLGALAAFAAGAPPVAVPVSVREEAARVVLDSIGCALAAVETPAGRIARSYADVLAGPVRDTTVIGVGRSSLHGAAYANCELVAALDMAPINQPGHVAPYVVATALAVAERGDRALAETVDAVAVGLEVAQRFASAMDTNRAVVDDRPVLSPVMGFASSIFAAAAAGTRLRDADQTLTADVLGIAAATSPVNSLRSWQLHTHSTSVKYGLGGGLVQAALHAVLAAELGHRGDRMILDDATHGYPAFIGTRRWEPEQITRGLGQQWTFPAGTHLKPYPHCRVTHGVFDALAALVEREDLTPGEIESITAHGEAWATGVPTYMNDEIRLPVDAQFSFRHGISVVAHRVPPGKAWQDPAVVHDPSVTALMERIEWRAHEGWADAYAAHPSARPARVEVVARGTTFVEERDFPRGSPSPDPATTFTTDEVVAKFRHNAAGVVTADSVDRVVTALTGRLSTVTVRDLMADLDPTGRTS